MMQWARAKARRWIPRPQRTRRALRAAVPGFAAVVVVAALCARAADAQELADAVAPATGFSVRNGPWGWHLMSPAGKRVFSLGVCVVNQGGSRADYDPANPGYAAWQHYETPAAWADATLLRLKSWNFTTVGGWSDLAELRESREQTLWLTPVLNLGAAVGAPWLDMWDAANLERMEKLAAERIDPLRDDPRVIGYYSDNELGWWNATMWTMTLEQPATSGQRQRLVQLLREIYADDWNALVADFTPEGAADWDQLAAAGGLTLRPGGHGVPTMRKFLALMADRYYQIMRDAIRRHDPDALFLGDRYQSFYYPEVVRASAQYVDVVSTNLNAHWNDGDFLRSYLSTLHALTEKPILVSEFYAAAMENRTGNKNASSGFPVVATQRERAAVARNTLHWLARTPYVIGADWFQFYDEPPLGRYDGEDYNFGLVDVRDEPYEQVATVFTVFDAEKFLSARMQPKPDATGGIPPAPADPYADFRFMTALKHWDRERAFVPPASDAPLGDLYVCWSPEAVFVGLYAWDVVERISYPNAVVPEADRARWAVALDDAVSVTALLGGGHAPVVSDPKTRVECLSGFDHDSRLIAVMCVPAASVGRAAFAPGDKLELRSNLVTHGRAYEFGWLGEYELAD